MNVLSFMRALLSRGDWVYTLSLLVPFVVYILVLKALDTASLPGDDYGIARTLNLMWSDIFFGFGYTLFWIGFFGAVRSRGLLRWSVVVLFHMTTILVIVMTTCAYEYFQLTGTTLSYGTLAEWLPKLSEIQPILLNGGVSSWIWVLLFFALLYATLGPWLVTRAVGWQHRGSRRFTEGRSK